MYKKSFSEHNHDTVYDFHIIVVKDDTIICA